MKHRGRFILFLVGFLPLFCYTQNLVPNPSFENQVSCVDPPPNESLQNCSDWFNAVEPLSTVDWFSTCYPSGTFYELPNLFFGFSYPHTGDAMIGLGPYSETTHIGECVGVRLLSPLVADSAYCVGFWIKNSNNQGLSYSMHQFDVSFVNDTAGINSADDINSYVSIANTEGKDWNYISTYYIAQGGEEYLQIGVFNPNPSYYIEPHEPGVGTYMYYYIDDVSLTRCDKDSILSVVLDMPNVFTPNDDHVNDLYEIRNNNIKTMEVVILNRWGNVVTQYDGLSSKWNGKDSSGNDVNEGVYFATVVAETMFGEVLTKQAYIHLSR